VLYTKSIGGSLLLSKKDVTIDDFIILSDYWSLLSKKSIENSAGVIDLFFKEVEKNKDNPEFITKKKNFIGQVIEVAQNAFNSIFGGGSGNQIVTIPLSSPQEENDEEPNEASGSTNQKESNGNAP